jgi:hypothetical protein
VVGDEIRVFNLAQPCFTDALEAQQLFHWQPGNNVKLTMNI